MINEELKLAKEQRLASLKNAISTINEFATPSFSPDEYNDFERLTQKLINIYGECEHEPINKCITVGTMFINLVPIIVCKKCGKRLHDLEKYNK